MENIFTFILISSSIYVLGVWANKTDVTNMIKDFVLLLNVPIKITSYLCWTRGETYDLVKTLNTYNILNNVLHVDRADIFITETRLHQMFLLDTDCVGYENILEVANDRKFFQQPYRWLLLKDKEISEDLDILVDSQFYTIEKIWNYTYQLNAIYKISSSYSTFITNDIGVWTSGKGFEYYNCLSIIRDRKDLMGMALNISFVIKDLDSLNHLWDYRFKETDAINKLSYLVSHHATDILNVTKQYIVQRTYGYRIGSTNQYDGMIGDLQRGVSELGGSPAYLSKDRSYYIDYSQPASTIGIAFIFRAPPLSYVENVYTLPFAKAVWYANFLLLGLFAIVLYLVVRWEWSFPEFRQHYKHTHTALRPRLAEVLIMELGAVCQQGAEAEPKNGPGRVATISIFVIFLFMYTSYSANIVALLQSTDNSLQTIEDLLNSKIKLGVDDVDYNHYYFRTETEPIRKALYEQKVAPKGKPSNFMDTYTGVKRVREEFFGFHTEFMRSFKIISDTFQDHEKCGLRVIYFLNRHNPLVIMKKNSSYKELFNAIYRRVDETGVAFREDARLYTKKPACHSTGNFMSVGLIDCYYAFVIFIIGTFCSLVVLALEVIVKRKTKTLVSNIKQ